MWMQPKQCTLSIVLELLYVLDTLEQGVYLCNSMYCW